MAHETLAFSSPRILTRPSHPFSNDLKYVPYTSLNLELSSIAIFTIFRNGVTQS